MNLRNVHSSFPMVNLRRVASFLHHSWIMIISFFSAGPHTGWLRWFWCCNAIDALLIAYNNVCNNLRIGAKTTLEISRISCSTLNLRENPSEWKKSAHIFLGKLTAINVWSKSSRLYRHHHHHCSCVNKNRNKTFWKTGGSNLKLW